MKNLDKNLISGILFGLITAFYWFVSCTVESLNSSFYISLISLGLIAALIYQKKIVASWNINRVYISILGFSAIYIICFFLWNHLFNSYSQNHDYSGNIFRGAFDGLRAPFYGHVVPVSKHDLIAHWPIISSSLLILIFLFLMRKRLHIYKYPWLLFILILLMIIGHSWYGNLELTFVNKYCHYYSFGIDVPKFDSIGNLMKTYNEKINSLNVHNNHYPPGNLMVLKIEELLFPSFSRLLVYSTTLFTLYPLYKLARLLEFDTAELNLVLILFGISGSILFFPGVALSPLMLPISVSGFYLLIKALKQKKLRPAFFFSLTIGVYTFFTFSSFVFLFFCALVVLFMLIYRETTIYFCLKFSLVFLSVFGLLFTLLYFSTGFDLLDCFIRSISNEQDQMDYSGISSWSRYFLTSTGNLIAYIGVLSMPVLSIVVHGFIVNTFSIPNSIKSLTYGLLFSIIILSFSNHFFLEVERIWIFLTPFCLFIAGWFLAQYYKKGSYSVVFSVIMSTIVISALLNIYIDFCY